MCFTDVYYPSELLNKCYLKARCWLLLDCINIFSSDNASVSTSYSHPSGWIVHGAASAGNKCSFSFTAETCGLFGWASDQLLIAQIYLNFIKTTLRISIDLFVFLHFFFFLMCVKKWWKDYQPKKTVLKKSYTFLPFNSYAFYSSCNSWKCGRSEFFFTIKWLLLRTRREGLSCDMLTEVEKRVGCALALSLAISRHIILLFFLSLSSLSLLLFLLLVVFYSCFCGATSHLKLFEILALFTTFPSVDQNLNRLKSEWFGVSALGRNMVREERSSIMRMPYWASRIAAKRASNAGLEWISPLKQLRSVKKMSQK